MTLLSPPLPLPADSWTLRLLGPPTLRTPAGLPVALERKAAALLAYLAVEGAARRSSLITLLWPSTPEAAARNNLVHLLRKLAAMAGRPLLEGRETLSLAPDVRADIAAFVPTLSGTLGDLDTLGQSRLLSTCTFDDCPELDDWLRAERERMEEWYLLALREHAARLEQTGDYGAALICVRRLLNLDPFSEDAHQRLMRLHALTGNRHRAWLAFERLCALLRREFGVDPLPETAALAQSLRQTAPPQLLMSSGSLLSA
ncbi:BTAD domain-containing putative transcriptional regulator [Deinococcus oregonensis]|uniref:BTAD domain-containing putative transcriptional regulator n=1 Tax=Deinococcus oregonensis TaxID=1805970 RepID=A0ABV6AWC8_9DEIO